MGTRAGKGRDRDIAGGVRDVLDRMEPDLKLLEGAVSLLRILSEAGDAIEPIAIEALAHMTGCTVERLSVTWREATDAARAS